MTEQKMRVLHVITSLGDGGAEAVLYRLVTRDTADEHEVVSLVGEGKYGRMFRAAGVPVYSLDMRPGRVSWDGIRKLWQICRASHADVIQTWMYHSDLLGGLVARLSGKPHVVWGIHNSTFTPGSSSRAFRAVVRTCGLLSLRVPSRIVVCAQNAALVHEELGYSADRMVVIPNGYDLSLFTPDTEARRALRAEWSVPDDVPLIGMVARFDPLKDHANLIAALAFLMRKGLRFYAVCIGTGMTAENAEMARRLEGAGVEHVVRLIGPRHDIPAVMNALDIHVLSSVGEAFPNVLCESMACGTPCVTTDVGDARLIVGETGWVVPPRHPEMLADALAAALSQWALPETWVLRQKAASKRINEHFGIDLMVERYRNVWTEVAD